MPETCPHLAALFEKFTLRLSVSEWGEVTIVCKECRVAWFLGTKDEQRSGWVTRILEPGELRQQDDDEDKRNVADTKGRWSSENL
ncbi:MAG: hypothetical protein KGJ23_07695 [Euryarchaeota archaeon]|nr:hypothetical protein [Euryarchaeota archaeon]MDE1836482.1 hypothetical protein [Euryarchaeota archaeon]MDE1880253.1 hypothetical protein [Euryarchaeota archaeon]MDE2044688.1 hypothetical protein [Thermoplasmata archaeon]